jgi:IS30 family transposase
MANHLKMALVHSILTVATQGWSHRRIARELGVDWETVSRHIRLAAEPANPANAPIGSKLSKRRKSEPEQLATAATPSERACEPASTGA